MKWWNRGAMFRPRRRMAGWTTLLGWAGIRWRRSAPPAQRAPRIFPIEQTTAHVSGEYRPLYTYLEHRYASVVVLTFEQIEALLGFALPTPARNQREWWTDSVDSHHHSAAWTGAGRTAAPNLSAETITFERPV
jgi:hypothetical protein